MNIVKRWSVKTKSDSVFVKVELKNFLKHTNVENSEFYLFCLMELTTNLVKYTQGGEIWLLEIEGQYAIASLDHDKGIENLEFAQQKGATTATNSLGLGLYQIRQNSKFDVEIYTSTQEDESGTIVLVKPKSFHETVLFLTQSYMDSKNNGDYFIKKGRFALFGDASGHGLKARRTADFVKKSFLDSPISCATMDSFYEKLHKLIKDQGLRSSIMVTFEVNRDKVSLCGMGNFGFWLEGISGYKYFTIKNGIIGETLRVSDKKDFQLHERQKLIACTDGNEPKRVTSYLKKLSNNYSSAMLALCIEHFVNRGIDDASVLIIQYKGNKHG